MPFDGAIADRYGAGRVLVFGRIAYALGLVGMAYFTTPLGLDLTTGPLIGMGVGCAGFGVVLAVVARAYPREKRSFAVGIAGTCGFAAHRDRLLLHRLRGRGHSGRQAARPHGA